MPFRLAFLLLALQTSVAIADAYRCTESGRVVISNSPCAASRVARDDNPSAAAYNQAQNDLARQRAYLEGREVEKQQDARTANHIAREVDRMYPVTNEPAQPSQSIQFRGCGLGGSCPTTTTRSR